MKLEPHSALVLVDVQKDFCPGGAVPVPDGDRVVPLLNQYTVRFAAARLPIYATRDWHPPNHISFKAQGGIWPPHCVQQSAGAELHPGLNLPRDAEIISKGTDSASEAYSGFQGTDFAERLRQKGVRRVFVGGLATDYCVKNTVLDALRHGFDAYVLADASRGVELRPGDVEKAIGEMKRAGAKSIRLEDLETP